MELARLVAGLCKRQPEIRPHPSRPGEIAHSLGDCRLIRRQLGLPNFVGLRSGLMRTLSWMEMTEGGNKSSPELEQ
jgi:nucleoside-diphosphate-sugar epimerase